MPNGYVFTDIRCPRCKGEGYLEGQKICPDCGGFGMLGCYKKEKEDRKDLSHSGFALVFGPLMRRYREKLKISMADMAERFHMSVVDYSHTERGRHTPTAEQQLMMNDWLNEIEDAECKAND